MPQWSLEWAFTTSSSSSLNGQHSQQIMPREIVLVGGGHAHVEVIRRYGEAPIPDTQLTVVDRNPFPVYSGMVPGFIAGQYKQTELEIDLRALCDTSGVDFEEGNVSKVERDSLSLDNGQSIPFEVASIDIGSTVAGSDCPGVQEFALASRPIATLVAEVEKVLESVDSTAPIHVVGGGAGGVELAFCLEARLSKIHLEHTAVAIVTSDSAVLASSAPAIRTRVERAFTRRGIEVLQGSPVSEVSRDSLDTSDGRTRATAATLWVTGPAAHALGTTSALPTDKRGFIRIEPSFQVTGYDNLFAVGDCASLPGMKKAGVFAVRAGPVLDRNIRAYLQGAPLRAYQPQQDFLSLLNLGDGTAIGSKFSVVAEGRWVMRLKDRIDRSFMEKYR